MQKKIDTWDGRKSQGINEYHRRGIRTSGLLCTFVFVRKVETQINTDSFECVLQSQENINYENKKTYAPNCVEKIKMGGAKREKTRDAKKEEEKTFFSSRTRQKKRGGAIFSLSVRIFPFFWAHAHMRVSPFKHLSLLLSSFSRANENTKIVSADNVFLLLSIILRARTWAKQGSPLAAKKRENREKRWMHNEFFFF